MKKHSVIAMALVLGLTSGVSFPAQAAGVNSKTKSKRYVVVKSQVKNLPEIKSALEDWCNQVQNGNWKDCPTITLPDCNQQGNGGQPGVPDNNFPDDDQTGGNVPEQDIPDDNISDSEVPENNQSGGNTGQPGTPDVNLPENGQPDSDQSDADVNNPDGDTNQPDTDYDKLSYAEQVVKLVNEERAKAGLHALKIDTEITSAALVRAKEIQTSFSHTRPDGRKFSTVLTDHNIRFTGAGENIAWGQTSPEKVMEAWMNSEGHRANILNAKFTKIGVGHLQNASGRNYWVQLFTY